MILLLTLACAPGEPPDEAGPVDADTARPTDAPPADTDPPDSAPPDETGAPASRPNILLLIGDDIGVDNIGVYAEHDDSAHTPQLDALAGDGVFFRNAWANPRCSPTRASIYTGKHAYRHGVLDTVNPRLRASATTLAEAFAEQGYATGLFGKWHLGEGDEDLPTEHGWQVFAGNRIGQIDSYFAWEKVVADSSGPQEPVTVTDYATEVVADDARSWIEAQDGPWFATVAFHAGHNPFEVPPSRLVSAATAATLAGAEGQVCDGSVDDDHACYRAMVEAMDTVIGELTGWLHDSGRFHDTLVVFVGDNGTAPKVVLRDGVFHEDHAKGTVYEGGVNVPLVLAGGEALGLTTRGELGELVQVLDLYDTVVEVAGFEPPSGTDATSLVPLLVGATWEPHATIYTERFHEQTSVDRWALTDGTAKLHVTEGVAQCFDLTADPGEWADHYETGGDLAARCDELAEQRPCLGGDCPDGS